MSFDKTLLRKVIEGALLAAGEPLSRERLMLLFPDDESQPGKDEVKAVIEEIQADCAGRGFELKEVGSGWRFQVVEEVAPWVNRLWEERPQKYSRAMLETLALIAYRQPITRGDIEEIRGVAVSSHIIKTLTERDWVKVVGHRDVPGRPSLYATTRHFLDYFNLKSLDELPTLGEIADLEKLNAELDFAEDKKLSEAGVSSEAITAAEQTKTTDNDSGNARSELEAREADQRSAEPEPEQEQEQEQRPVTASQGASLFDSSPDTETADMAEDSEDQLQTQQSQSPAAPAVSLFDDVPVDELDEDTEEPSV